MGRNFIGALCSAVLIGSFVLAGSAVAQQKTTKECNSEWTAKKAANQTTGLKKKDFMATCLGTAPPATATKPAQNSTAKPAGAAAPPATPPAATKPGSTTTTKPAKGQAATGAGQFATEAQAKSHCPQDTVVWVNLESKIYHYGGNKSYGTTKSGTYMCEADTAKAGYRAAKSEKRP